MTFGKLSDIVIVIVIDIVIVIEIVIVIGIAAGIAVIIVIVIFIVIVIAFVIVVTVSARATGVAPQRARVIFRSMQQQWLSPNMITVSTTISACETDRKGVKPERRL